ncbi:outer membrane beta-barrel protein [Alteromonadaceae bacterium 2753L.S.0a.02]|nr:outer membrane beta-barrel protein [Alteromonadaceae bacterium 2753L.S.0a.02]
MPFFKALRSICPALCIVIGLTPAIAQAAEKKDQEISIIQERLFDKKREIGFAIGYIPDDNFYHTYPLTLNYVNHFNQRYAWEVIRVSYMINKDRDIKRDLEKNFGVTPSTFDEFTSHIESSFIIKPTYGKDSVFNKHIINHEGYMSLGLGVATFEKQVSYGNPQQDSALTASIGIGRKYFVGKAFNISLDLKEMLVFKENKTENFLYLGVGFNYRFDLFGSMKPKRNQDNSIYQYLD